jgi:cytochrome c-type biogenesis protein CcmH
MALWFVFAMMTAAAIFAVLWPLGRGRRAVAGGSDTEVYKDQLQEVARDAAAGLIAPADAEAVRVEIARRLLAADAAQMPARRISLPARRTVAVVALIGVPLIAIATYLPRGAPDMPDMPLASRRAPASATEPLERLVAQVEAHLEKNPSDGRGWTVLAPVLLKIGRADDAARAFRNAITYAGETADRRADLGEALVASSNGVVTSDAKIEFERAVSLDAANVKPRYFLGLAAEQDGRPADAAKLWRALLAEAPQDAPWRDGVQAALSRVQGSAPALPEGAMESVAGLDAGERTVMIRGMVERLATRLKSEGGEPEAWLRLVRAYMVLGDRDKARDARSNARQALAGKAEALKQFDEGVKPLGIDG